MMINIDWASWGEIVHLRRRRKKLTQQHLGELAGCGATTIGDIERGTSRPAYSIVIAVCTALNIAPPAHATVEA